MKVLNMKKSYIIFLALLISLLLFFNCSKNEHSVQVIRIVDGDTIVVLKDGESVKIRLEGIDCPEKKQPYGQTAKEFTKKLCNNKRITLKIKEKDRYGRYIATVFLPNGSSLNEELISKGLAWHYKKYDDNPKLANLELQARGRKIGLWKNSNPIPPWVYRKRK